MNLKNLVCFIVLCLNMTISIGRPTDKNRGIILTDIEAVPEDTQSLIRLSKHPPFPFLSHVDQPVVTAGENFSLDVIDSTDPDSDGLSFLWFNYPEVGSYKKKIPVNGAENTPIAYFTASEVTKAQVAQFLVKVTGKGSPPLSRYKGVQITILPN